MKIEKKRERKRESERKRERKVKIKKRKDDLQAINAAIELNATFERMYSLQ